jgi:hypothetical protein
LAEGTSESAADSSVYIGFNIGISSELLFLSNRGQYPVRRTIFEPSLNYFLPQ